MTAAATPTRTTFNCVARTESADFLGVGAVVGAISRATGAGLGFIDPSTVIPAKVGARLFPKLETMGL